MHLAVGVVERLQGPLLKVDIDRDRSAFSSQFTRARSRANPHGGADQESDMIKKLAFVVVAAAFLATPALAQTTPAPAPAPAAGAAPATPDAAKPAMKKKMKAPMKKMVKHPKPKAPAPGQD
jgi:hypothetical protein